MHSVHPSAPSVRLSTHPLTFRAGAQFDGSSSEARERRGLEAQAAQAPGQRRSEAGQDKPATHRRGTSGYSLWRSASGESRSRYLAGKSSSFEFPCFLSAHVCSHRQELSRSLFCSLLCPSKGSSKGTVASQLISSVSFCRSPERLGDVQRHLRPGPRPSRDQGQDGGGRCCFCRCSCKSEPASWPAKEACWGEPPTPFRDSPPLLANELVGPGPRRQLPPALLEPAVQTRARCALPYDKEDETRRLSPSALPISTSIVQPQGGALSRQGAGVVLCRALREAACPCHAWPSTLDAAPPPALAMASGQTLPPAAAPSPGPCPRPLP